MKDFLLVAGLLAAPASVSVQQYNASPAVKQSDPRLSLLQTRFQTAPVAPRWRSLTPSARSRPHFATDRKSVV